MDNSVLNGTGKAAGDAIKALRADITPLTAGTGLAEGVTGAAAQQLDSQQSGTKAEVIVLFATLLLILILLLIIFRSPIIAIMPLIVIGIVSQVATGLIADVNQALPPGTYAIVGGTTAVFADIQRAINHDYTVVFPVAAVIILIILALLLRSLVAPWYLMVSVGLGFAATLGASVLVFQVLGGQTGLVFLLPALIGHLAWWPGHADRQR